MNIIAMVELRTLTASRTNAVKKTARATGAMSITVPEHRARTGRQVRASRLRRRVTAWRR